MISREVDRNNFKYPEYIYRKPILSPVPVRNFQGKSLEEIERDYGKDVAQGVYWSACHGNDLTSLAQPDCHSKDFVDFEVSHSNHHAAMYLLPRDETEATEKKQVMDISSRRMAGEIANRLFNDVFQMLNEGK